MAADRDQQRIAEASRGRGWSYEPTMAELKGRWDQNPFRARAQNPPFGPPNERLGKVVHVVSGASQGRPFWALEWGDGSELGLMMAFISAGSEVPPVSVAPRGVPQAAAMSALLRSSRRATWRGTGSDPRERLFGPDIGDDDFRGQFQIEARDERDAAWLLCPGVRERLLRERWLGLTSRGIDVICWKNQAFDVDKLDPMLSVLAAVNLAT